MIVNICRQFCLCRLSMFLDLFSGIILCPVQLQGPTFPRMSFTTTPVHRAALQHGLLCLTGGEYRHTLKCRTRLLTLTWVSPCQSWSPSACGKGLFVGRWWPWPHGSAGGGTSLGTRWTWRSVCGLSLRAASWTPRKGKFNSQEHCV